MPAPDGDIHHVLTPGFPPSPLDISTLLARTYKSKSQTRKLKICAKVVDLLAKMADSFVQKINMCTISTEGTSIKSTKANKRNSESLSYPYMQAWINIY